MPCFEKSMGSKETLLLAHNINSTCTRITISSPEVLSVECGVFIIIIIIIIIIIYVIDAWRQRYFMCVR